ncbi:MAG: L,D-transpeptidase family protein [Bacillota bacterium]|nr:L,D-transpeptidase family protein [Bacillota bacterium]
MKNFRSKKVICILVMAVMLLSSTGVGVFATEGIEGEPQEQDVNKIISVSTVRGHQRIMLKWEVSDKTEAAGYIIDRYSVNTGKWDKEYATVDKAKGKLSETEGQFAFQMEDRNVGDGLIDSKTGKVRGGTYKYRITPYTNETVTKYALTIKYVDEDDPGNEVADSVTKYYTPGEHYSVDSPKVEGYELDGESFATVEGVMPEAKPGPVVVKYRKVASDNSPDADEDISASVSEGSPVTAIEKQNTAPGSISEDIQKTYTEGAIESKNTSCVRTSYVYVTLKVKKKLTSHQSSNNKTINLKKGTRVKTCGFYSGKYVFVYDNHVYWLTRISTKKASTSYNRDDVYSKEEAEYFVNSRGTDSGKYLIWVNTYSQRLYIFTGSKGNWELKSGTPWKVSTGKASSPTIRTIDPKGIPTKGIHRGYYTIKKKLKKRHNIPYWNCLSGYNAIHGKKSKWSINSVPKSGGCIRNTNGNAQWIYNNCAKNNTNVIIF